MKNYFIEDYDKTIDDISAKVGDIYDSNGGYIGNMNGWDGE